MRTYPIVEDLELPTRDGLVTANFQVILSKQVYVLTEDLYRVVRGAIFLWNARMQIYQIYPGLFEAIRGTKHAMKGYGLADARLDEHGELHQLTLSRSAISVLLRQIWDYGNLSDRQRDEYAAGCLALAKEHEFVKDEGKVIARDRMARASSVISSLGYPNWPSRAPMLWSSADKLEQRQINIRHIARWVDVRQFALLLLLDEMYEIIHGVYELADQRPVVCQVRDLKIEMSEAVVLPFRHGFYRTSVDLREACRRLSLPNQAARGNADKYLDRAKRAMAVYMIRRDLEPIIWGLTSELTRRKANRRADVLDQALQDLVAFCEYVNSILGFDKMFRNPILPRMYHHLSNTVQAGRLNQWGIAKQELAKATIMF
jgi:hypothetical protein